MVYTKADLNPNLYRHGFYGIHRRLFSTKSVFIYERSYPMHPMDIDFITHVLRIRINYVHTEPLLYVVFVLNGIENNICIPYVNVFKDYVISVKLKNKKRCNICQLKKKCIKSCYRCCDKYCSDCFYKFNEKEIKACPYCRYTFKEHIKFWMSIVNPDNSISPIKPTRIINTHYDSTFDNLDI